MARFDNVIVGGGLAAGMVAQEYRGADGDGSVLLIGREAHPPYHRPPLTKGFLRGEEPVEDTYMHSLDEWRELDVELRLSTEVAAIDPAARTVELVDGERIEYGRMALATGSTPRTLGEAATIRVIEDSERVGALLNTGSGHLGVIGGGFIGVEAAASARMKGLDVTLVAPEPVLWSHLFGEQVGAYFQGHMERHGVRVLMGQKTLPDGDYDMILAGIGVSPNIELAQNAGLPTNQGVLADDHLVAAPDIWVAGDIAEYQSVIHGRRIRIEHWDVALNHGSYIGKSWAGAEEGPYRVVPYFFSDIGDWTWMEYVGPGDRDDTVEVRGSMDDDDFVAYYSNADGKLTACLAVNRGDELNAARELIANGGGVPA
ncbi:MAG TPA: FAD-dependent oxidoreductase [Gaiellales bacterium]|nr:FAD-dependent oxidoreductase [Gaiellales bacterium]